MEAEIKFEKGEISIKVTLSKLEAAAIYFIDIVISNLPGEVEDAVIPVAWAIGIPRQSKAAKLITIQLRQGARPVRLKQYPTKIKARRGLEPLINQFCAFGLLVEWESKFNTLILPVKKANGKDYRLVQDLRAINKIVEDIHPMVANPYTLLTTLHEKLRWFTVVNLKYAFFCIPLSQESQELFAFEWESPETGHKTKLTWSILPQRF